MNCAYTRKKKKFVDTIELRKYWVEKRIEYQLDMYLVYYFEEKEFVKIARN